MKKKKGFTLLEMVIVIGIIALLLSIAIPRFQKTNRSAKILTHDANVKMLKNAAILYLNDHPEADTVPIDQLKVYIEGDIPKPARFLKEKSFTIEYSKSNGSIEVKPGELDKSKYNG